MSKLRSYQNDLSQQILSADTNLNILAQADTGAGKTHIIADVIKASKLVIVVAHRNILIRQASLVLAKHAIFHASICSEHTRRMSLLEHRKIVGKEYLKQRSKRYVSSIDRLLSLHRRRLLNIDVSLPWRIIVDEAHHMIDENKWGTLLKIFPNAQIVGFTATPCRGDGKSLKRGQGGVFDVLIQAEELRENSVRKLISWGYLSDFVVYSIPEPTGVDTSKLVIGKDGEYTHKSLLGVYDGSAYTFAGSAIEHYRRLAEGLQTVVFCISIKIAELTAKRFREAGYSAACISSEMSPVEQSRIFDLFRMKAIQIICHVDMIGEGVDVPAIEAIIMLRKTASFGNFRQWVGRAMRPEPGKNRAILIDHVANVLTHGMPDEHVEWSLEHQIQPKKSNLIACEACDATYKAWLRACPECGHITPERLGTHSDRDALQYLDINLVERERWKVEKKWREENEIILPHFVVGTGALGQAAGEIIQWFSNSVRPKYSISQINEFLRGEAGKIDFWIDRFTLADISAKRDQKCLKEMRQWQKLH